MNKDHVKGKFKTADPDEVRRRLRTEVFVTRIEATHG